MYNIAERFQKITYKNINYLIVYRLFIPFPYAGVNGFFVILSILLK